METETYVEEVDMDLTADDFSDDCESIFHNDIREKKMAGRGAFGKTSCTRSRNGGMPSDFLKGKKLREYMGNSEVKTYNLNDIGKNERRKSARRLNPSEEKKICDMYSGGETARSILNEFQISCPTLYNVLKRNNIAKRVDKLVYTPVDNVECGSVSWELQSDCETEAIQYKEPEHLAEEIAINYQWEYEHLKKKCELLKEENEKYRIALLNMATRMI